MKNGQQELEVEFAAFRGGRGGAHPAPVPEVTLGFLPPLGILVAGLPFGEGRHVCLVTHLTWGHRTTWKPPSPACPGLVAVELQVELDGATLGARGRMAGGGCVRS